MIVGGRDYEQQQLGDIVFVEMTAVGTSVRRASPSAAIDRQGGLRPLGADLRHVASERGSRRQRERERGLLRDGWRSQSKPTIPPRARRCSTRPIPTAVEERTPGSERLPPPLLPHTDGRPQRLDAIGVRTSRARSRTSRREARLGVARGAARGERAGVAAELAASGENAHGARTVVPRGGVLRALRDDPVTRSSRARVHHLVKPISARDIAGHLQAISGQR